MNDLSAFHSGKTDVDEKAKQRPSAADRGYVDLQIR